MARVTGILSIVFVALAAAATPANGESAAVDPQMLCPDMFAPFTALIAPPGTDKNGNSIVCAKPADGMIIWRDDLLKTS
jgi:hypothetical protein